MEACLKNLAVSTVPLLMPYIQRRLETVGGKPFKLVSTTRRRADQPRRSASSSRA